VADRIDGPLVTALERFDLVVYWAPKNWTLKTGKMAALDVYVVSDEAFVSI
jgi:hypothetical protein